jgi:hypothetical protein
MPRETEFVVDVRLGSFAAYLGDNDKMVQYGVKWRHHAPKCYIFQQNSMEVDIHISTIYDSNITIHLKCQVH